MAFGVTCPTCGKAFSVTDEIYERKVKGRVVTIKCKQCQAGIRVDATKPGDVKISAAAKGAAAEDHKSIETKSVMPALPQALAQAQALVQPKPPAPVPQVHRRQQTLIGVASPVLAPPPPAAAPARAGPAPVSPPAPKVAAGPREPSDDILWAVETSDGQDLELTWSALRQQIESGKLSPATLVWREGMAEWLEAEQVPELAAFVKRAVATRQAEKPLAAAGTPGALPAAPKLPVPPAPRARPISTAADDVPTLPPEANAAPEPSSSPALSEELPTAPKGLTPLPLPVGALPAPPKPPPPRPSTPGAPSPAAEAAAPAALTPAPPDPWLEAAKPAPAFPPAAPPAPPRTPVPAPRAAAPQATFATQSPVATNMDFELPMTRSKAPFVIAGIGLIAAVVVALVVLKGGDNPPPAITVPTAAEARNTSNQPATTVAPNAAADGTPAGRATAPSGAPETTPGAGFAESFAAAAKNAEGGDPASGRFDATAAKKALAPVLAAVAQCKEPGGPRGKLQAIVAFEPSGKVSGVTINESPFAGTSTASCAAAALKQARMPPFKGLPGTVSQVVSMR